MQPRRKRRGSRIIIEYGAMGKPSGSPASRTLRKLGRTSQLVVRQRGIRRVEAGIAFGLEATGDINNADQTDLAHSLYSHDADAASICHS